MGEGKGQRQKKNPPTPPTNPLNQQKTPRATMAKQHKNNQTKRPKPKRRTQKLRSEKKGCHTNGSGSMHRKVKKKKKVVPETRIEKQKQLMGRKRERWNSNVVFGTAEKLQGVPQSCVETGGVEEEHPF